MHVKTRTGPIIAGEFYGSVRSDGKRGSAGTLRPIELKGADSMKKVVLSVVAALAVSAAAPAFAADLPSKAPKAVAPAPPPSPWDIAFGAAIMNDYIFRGVTQSGHKPSVAAYFEPRYNINSNWQLYAGISGESIKFANNAAAEIDFYGGVRPTFGPLAFDFGFWYYYYPGGQCYGRRPARQMRSWIRAAVPAIPPTATSPSRLPASTKSTARLLTPGPIGCSARTSIIRRTS